jgi:hypothetical protein
MSYVSNGLAMLSLCSIVALPAGALAQSTIGGGTPGQSTTGNDPANSGTHMGDPDVAPATNGTTGTDVNKTHHHHHHTTSPTTATGSPAPSGSDDNTGSNGSSAPH